MLLPPSLLQGGFHILELLQFHLLIEFFLLVLLERISPAHCCAEAISTTSFICSASCACETNSTSKNIIRIEPFGFFQKAKRKRIDWPRVDNRKTNVKAFLSTDTPVLHNEKISLGLKTDLSLLYKAATHFSYKKISVFNR